MEAVDVLCYNRCEMSAPLELREGVVPRVRRRIEIDEAPPIEVEELSRVRHEKAVRRHLLRTELLMQRLAVYPARTAKVGDPRLRGHARPTEEDRTAATLQDFFEPCDLVHGRPPFILQDYGSKSLMG